jgi:hypothetical protein
LTEGRPHLRTPISSAKKVDLTFDLESEKAELYGDITIAYSQLSGVYPGDIDPIAVQFSRAKKSRVGKNILSLRSKESNFLCGRFRKPCSEWFYGTFDKNTGVFEYKNTYTTDHFPFSQKFTKYHIKFKCKKNS